MSLLRDRFLRLSQLQKALVFGGLGMVSGWATPVFMWLLLRGAPPSAAFVVIIISPGLFLGLFVLTPLAFLKRSPGFRRAQPLLSGAAIHWLAMASFGLLPSLMTRYEPDEWIISAAAAVGGSLHGFLLGIISLRPLSPRNVRILWLTTFSMGCMAALAIAAAQRISLLPAPMVAGHRLLIMIWTAALVLVTIHVTAAVCLSLQEWPAASKNPP